MYGLLDIIPGSIKQIIHTNHLIDQTDAVLVFCQAERGDVGEFIASCKIDISGFRPIIITISSGMWINIRTFRYLSFLFPAELPQKMQIPLKINSGGTPGLIFQWRLQKPNRHLLSHYPKQKPSKCGWRYPAGAS